MNRLRRLSAVAVFVCLVVLSAHAPAASPEDIAAVVDGNNTFALELYQQLAGASEDNLFCSPYSVSTALAMTYAGARGNTAVQMAETLHFPLSAEDFHTAMGGLIDQINDPAREGYSLAVANRLWGQVGYPFLPEFLGTVEENYGAGLEQMDFIGAPEPSRLTINQWVEDQTSNKIKDLLPPDGISPQTRLVLTNAIYFLGDWQYKFDPELTTDTPFYTAPDENIILPMMHQEQDLRYAEYDGLQVIEFPYNNEELSLVALLPEDIDGLPALEQSLTSESLDTYLDGLSETSVSVHLPKFEMTCKFELRDALTAMGMTDAFTGAADFSGIDGTRSLFISKILHKAFIQLDEEGTEAAAATAVVMEYSSADPLPEFRADHPFLFLIRDNVTDSILFLGRVMEPEASTVDAAGVTLDGDLNGDGLVNSADLDIVRGQLGTKRCSGRAVRRRRHRRRHRQRRRFGRGPCELGRSGRRDRSRTGCHRIGALSGDGLAVAATAQRIAPSLSLSAHFRRTLPTGRLLRCGGHPLAHRDQRGGRRTNRLLRFVFADRRLQMRGDRREFIESVTAQGTLELVSRSAEFFPLALRSLSLQGFDSVGYLSDEYLHDFTQDGVAGEPRINCFNVRNHDSPACGVSRCHVIQNMGTGR